MLEFQCPGCGDIHAAWTQPHGQGGAVWQWNGSMDKPTFSPSLLITSGHHIASHKPGGSCWCTWNATHPDQPAPFTCYRCHSFIKDGQIQFLGDCTHAMAGKTVEIPEWP
jgi:hypothetical protein